jgi:hypothetical protein
MSRGWLDGYGQRPPAPRPPPVPIGAKDASPAVAVVCPQCGSKAIKVRDSNRTISLLLCHGCQHEWRTSCKVERVLIFRTE